MLLCILSNAYLHGQETISTAGGTATGIGGSATYTVGQVTCNTLTGTNGSVAQGVQQPYEISIATSINNTDDISLTMIVYPNPTSGSVKLIVRSFESSNLRYQLFDLNGILLQDRKIESEETEIFLKDIRASIYFLKVVNNNQTVKVFKVVKK